MLATMAVAAAPLTSFSRRVDATLLERLARRVSCAPGRDRLDVQLPFTGELLGTVPRCSPADVVDAANQARDAQRAWAAVPVRDRAAVLLRFHDLLLARREAILDLVQLESGKARRDAFEELCDVAIVARYYANVAGRLLRPRRRQGALPFLTATWEHRPPLGLAGFIVPWNYPLTLSITDAVPAIVAGNGVLIKPDAQTPYSALWIASLLEDAGLPRGVIQIVTGHGAELGPTLIEQIDFLMFTGSTATGRIVARQAGERLIDCSMELGGKNAMIVLDDADLGRVVPGAVHACFSNTGQLCISIERLYIHRSIYNGFVRGFVAATRSLRLGTALDLSSVDVGSLVSHKQLETISHHVDDAVGKGARVLAGGRARPDIGPYFYEPTILEGVKEGMLLHQEETFGPVVSVYSFESDEEAIASANDSPYGLNFSVWTRDTRRGRRVAERLQAGTININEGYGAAWGSTDAPMGGVKSSGIGRRHGAQGLLKYTSPRTISVQRLVPIAGPSFLRRTMFAAAVVATLKILRRTPGVK